MKIDGHTNFVSIDYNASSLYSLIADGNYRATRIGREKWKSLIFDSSLQVNCNKEGFNVKSLNIDHATFRLGIAGNDGASCNTPDSFLGFGGYVDRLYCTALFSSDLNICGNFAGCSADNGNQTFVVMGYILVR